MSPKLVALDRFNRATLAALTGAALLCVVSVATVVQPRSAGAFPAYAEKEAVHCVYCHVMPGGGGKRNYRGKYYKKNGLTFAAFDDAAEAQAASVPVAPEPEPKPKSLAAAAGAAKPADAPPASVPAASPTPAPSATPPSASIVPPKHLTFAELKKQAATTGALYTKNPADANAKKGYSEALALLSVAQLEDAKLAPATKYAAALQYARQSVKLNPANQTAAETIKRVTQAYQKMGKPLPK